MVSIFLKPLAFDNLKSRWEWQVLARLAEDQPMGPPSKSGGGFSAGDPAGNSAMSLV